MKDKELSFIGGDPGATKYGNFINYYSFHSTKERTDCLHPDMFVPPVTTQPILCLDIGCNTGLLSKELYSYLKNIYPSCAIDMLGIDIDPTLIQRAAEANDNRNIKFTEANIMNETDKEIIEKYLKAHEKNKFDVTFCFSVTMWIHINNGDEGLMHFLSFIQDISETIIIEPQPWKCYRNAQRRMKKSGSSFPLYDMIKIKNDIDIVIEGILTKIHFKKVYESPSAWNRKIQSYQKKKNTKAIDY